jgi:hypothetical protein
MKTEDQYSSAPKDINSSTLKKKLIKDSTKMINKSEEEIEVENALWLHLKTIVTMVAAAVLVEQILIYFKIPY